MEKINKKLSQKYDFKYNTSDDNVYVTLKDSDDWRLVENYPQELKFLIMHPPLEEPEDNPMNKDIPFMYWNQWSDSTKIKYRNRIEREKSKAHPGFIQSTFNRIRSLIEDFVNPPEKRKYQYVMTDPEGHIEHWFKEKQGGKLIPKNPIQRFKNI